MNDIEAMLKATIQTKVIEAFNTAPEMIEKMVAAAFSREVNESGFPPNRNSYGETKMPYIDWLVGEEIRRAATEAVREYMATHRDQVKVKVVAAIEAGAFGEKIGEKIADIMAEDYRWSFRIERKD